MLANLKNQVVLVWLVLVLMTSITWAIGVKHGHAHSNGPNFAMAAILAIAFLKTQLIGSYFMELRAAPLPLRFAFSGWVVGTGAILIAMYFLL